MGLMEETCGSNYGPLFWHRYGDLMLIASSTEHGTILVEYSYWIEFTQLTAIGIISLLDVVV